MNMNTIRTEHEDGFSIDLETPLECVGIPTQHLKEGLVFSESPSLELQDLIDSFCVQPYEEN